ncbi:serine hydrolase domain-containing protein [Hymenobacter sp. APR13]|uniref:serine hydrolase domain-containing protein n=1 Tax=Hymenobacter sp. APR13 TaxID=1356852 RepID=UPI0009DCF398|nr:serine hydrolase domain-containing protein [Hymenobacter sp. APR13]
MSWLRLVLALLLAGVLRDPASAQVPGRALRQLLRASVDTTGPAPVPSVLLVASSPRGRWHWAGQAGWVRNGGARVDARTPVRLASVTKTFTAAVVLQLVEEGRLALDVPLTAYLPAGFVDSLHAGPGGPAGRQLTVRRLLRHTTGLADYILAEPSLLAGVHTPPARPWTPRRLWQSYFARGLHLRPLFWPNDSVHAYSDTNYLLLGTLIEWVCGQPLAAVYRQRIFRPLGLRSAYLEYHEPAPTRRAAAHPYWGRTDVGRLPTGFDWGGGGLAMTTRDLHTFWRALLAGRLFRQPATRLLLFDWVATPAGGYGAGLARAQPPGLPPLVGHAGFYKAFVAYFPELDLYLCGTLNQAHADHVELVRRLLPLLPAAARSGAGLPVPAAGNPRP